MQRRVFGQPLIAQPVIRAKLANMITGVVFYASLFLDLLYTLSYFLFYTTPLHLLTSKSTRSMRHRLLFHRIPLSLIIFVQESVQSWLDNITFQMCNMVYRTHTPRHSSSRHGLWSPPNTLLHLTIITTLPSPHLLHHPSITVVSRAIKVPRGSYRPP
jgi:hypothetical protein